MGRDSDLALLIDEVERARRGRGRVVLIRGEAGSGKSRILSEILGRASGFDVFAAAAREIERDRPFGVVSEALGLTRASEDPARAAIATVLRSADEQPSGLRFRIADDIADLVERLSLERPIVVACDDVQWADEASVLALHVIARHVAHLPVLVAATARPVPRPPGLDALEAEASEGGRAITLDPLGDDDAATIANAAFGVEPGPRLRALLASAGGNPFFLTELLSALEEEGSVDTLSGRAEVSSETAPPELHLVILRRLASLSAGAIAALRMASVLGSSFSVTDLARVLGTVPSDLLAPIDELTATGVLTDEGSLLRFRHDLVREALSDDIPASAREALHRQAAAALASAGASPDIVAAHFAAGATSGDIEAVTWLRTAATATPGAAPATITKWLTRALDLLPEGDPRRDEVIAELAPALSSVGELAAAEATAVDALSRPQPPHRRAALRRALAEVQSARGRPREAAAIYEGESEAPDLSEVERIRLAAHGVEQAGGFAPFETEPRMVEVLARAERADDPYAITVALAALFAVAWWRGDIHEAVSLAERALEQTKRDPELQDFGVGNLLAMACITADRSGDARRVVADTLARAESRGTLPVILRCLNQLAWLDFDDGAWDDSSAHAEAVIQLMGHRGLIASASGGAELFITQISARRGDLDRARAILQERAARAPGSPPNPSTEPWFWEASGEPDRALAALREIARAHTELGHTRSLLEYATHLVRLEMTIGEHDRIGAIADGVEEAAARMRTAWADAVALHARACSELDTKRILAAVERARASSRPILAASIEHDAGALLARAGRTDEAIELHTAAVGFFERAGASWDVARIEAALRALGARRGKRGPRARPKTGWGSLTETERRVVDLATQGLTNAEVGARMFLSGRTVERHLTHVYTKLGISSRVALASVAARTRA